MKLFVPKMVMASIIGKIHIILSKCDNVIESIQIHVSFLFFSLKICTNVKNKYEKAIFDHFLFFEKKVIRFPKS